MMEQFLQQMANTRLATILTTIAAVGSSFDQILTFVVVAYLAITLSATALRTELKGLSPS
jgi:hypothetical protein